MASRPKLLIPGPDADRPRPLPLALAAIVPFVVGLWVVGASLEDEPTTHAARTESAHGARPPIETAESATDPETDSESETDSASETDSETETETETETDSETASESETAAPAPIPRRVGLGRVAYLKCDGAPPAPGPFPCPRDRDLEATVWAALETLPECPSLPTETGPADLRLTFVPGTPVEIATRSRGPESLPDEALLACLTEPLSEVTTSIRADDLLVSFHFALLSRDR